ncbi:GAP family protein [Herbiconiux sp. CPCC 203407]|uniref:GAP family protein n=1 Tax=Herbiconiux oxytropis TaxID=2970915 RepID=A0AA41XG78_9MICO|nr:GAP family protein [Herbiconiux oxytropis]MCS5722041.1 GAP family protein [Herbiconiux oxytropis]MCS5725624.1 GAP family protein [Herbiconiux oxytropis]
MIILLSVIGAVTVFVLPGGILPGRDETEGPDLPRAIVQFTLATLLVLPALRQWRGRPRDGQDPGLPKWMAAIDDVTFARALDLGFLLSDPTPERTSP